MATCKDCKDCIHYDICIFHLKGDENKKCIRFKNKADVVEVVRCKDCKHRETYECPMYFEEDIEWDDDGYTECETVVHDSTAENAYCSYGERRENNAE